MTSPEDLAALLGSRICHDLISPLGAISNGVELLEMSGGSIGPEIALISESVENANARIKFFRVAFGLAGDDQRLGAAEIRGILADMTRGGRLRIDWRAEGDLRRPEVKLVFLMLLCLETALPRGGEIAVTQEAGEWRIAARADNLRLDQRLWESLLNPNGGNPIGAAEVQFLLLPLLLRAAGRSLAMDLGETAIDARF